MKAYLALIITIILWSLSSVIVVNFRGAFPPFFSASITVIFAFIIYSAYLRVYNFQAILDLKLIPRKYFLKLFTVGVLGLFLYPIFYFLGLHSSKPLEANVLNYTWPLIAIITGFVIKTESFGIKKLLGVVLSFIGALFATLNFNYISDYTKIEISSSYILTYVIAFVGALIYGTYSAFLKVLKVELIDGRYLSTISKFYLFLLIALVLHLIFLLLNLPNLGNIININLTTNSLLFLGSYIVFNFCIAHFLWLYSMEKLKLPLMTVAAFMIPILSTLLLSFFTNKALNTEVGYGIVLIVTGLILAQNIRLNALLITIILFIILGFATYLVPVIDESNNYLNIVAIMITIFAIYSGFILTRLHEQNVKENTLFAQIESKLLHVCQKNCSNSVLVTYIDEYMTFLIESFCSSNRRYDIAHIDFIKVNNKMTSNLLDHLKNDKSLILEINSLVAELSFLRNIGITSSEWIILIIQASVLSFLFFLTRENTFISDIVVITFCSSLFLCLLIIRNYESKTPTNSLVSAIQFQKISIFLSLPVYLPDKLITNYLNGFEFYFSKVEITFRNKFEKNKLLKQGNRLIYFLVLLFLLFLLALVSFLLFLKSNQI
jgi:drug/metabolite transporter (DMT)-like permease